MSDNQGFFEFSMMRAHDSIPKKRMAEALHAYVHGDSTFVDELWGYETMVGRTVVHETAFADDMPEVLEWERATRIIEDATDHAVTLCYCRHEAEHLGACCDAPKDNCLTLNGAADFIIRRGFGRKIERSNRSHVPYNTMDRVIRQALERGRLAHLMFDGGGSIGNQFLNGAIRALTALPGAKKAMASEQLKSRFVRYALGSRR